MVALLALSACGYRFVAPLSQLPEGIRAVRVPMFDNRTAEPSAELLFTRAARDALHRAGLLGGDDATAELKGSVVSITSYAFMTSPTLPRQPGQRMTVTVSLKLENEGRPVNAATVTVTEEFPSGADVLLTESNRQQALHRLAEAAVREGLERFQTTGSAR